MSESIDDNGPKLIRLMSNDGKEFQILERIATMSHTIKCMIEENSMDVILIPNVDGKTLATVIEFCDHHSRPDVEAMNLDSNFLKTLDDIQMMKLTFAADFLEVPELLNLLFRKHADNIKNLSVEDVREYFGIENDFSVEEEAKIREENSWAFS